MEVRAKLAALPAGQRKQALKDWADAKVKVDRDSESKALMGRLSNTDASREYVSGGFGGVIGPWLDEINAGMQAATRSPWTTPAARRLFCRPQTWAASSA